MNSNSPAAADAVREDARFFARLEARFNIAAFSRHKAIVWILLASFALRAFMAAVMPLAADEAYAVVVSRSHALSYYDHPPIAFALARLVADLTGRENSFLMRLPFVALGSGSALLLYDITRRCFGTQAAIWTSAAFACSPFFLAAAGTLIVPDGPLDFFLLLSLWSVQPALLENRTEGWRWLLAGAALGFAMMSKYQAVLFAMSGLAALILQPEWRKHLLQPAAWLAVALAVSGAFPTLLWNSHHNWASFAFQGGRAMAEITATDHARNMAEVLAGQALYLLPVTWFAAQRAVWHDITKPASPSHRLFAILAILPIAAFDILAITGSHSLPHWSMSGFLFALPLVGASRAAAAATKPMGLKVRLAVAGTAMIASVLLVSVQSRTGLLSGLAGTGAGLDGCWQNISWSALRPAVGDADELLVAPGWVAGGQIGLAAGASHPVDVLSDPHHFQYMDRRPKAGTPGLYVEPLKNNEPANGEISNLDALKVQYTLVGPVRRITQTRAGRRAFVILIVPVRHK